MHFYCRNSLKYNFSTSPQGATIERSLGSTRVMFELLVGVLVGFACGYGVREYISRRRRAAALDRAITRQEHIDNLKLMAKLDAPLAEMKSKSRQASLRPRHLQ
jgi:hypothetical protein